MRLRAIDREPCFRAFSDQPLLLNELISALSALQRHRLQRDAETDQRSTTQLVDDLTVAALQHRAVRHPYLEALAKGSLPDPRFAFDKDRPRRPLLDSFARGVQAIEFRFATDEPAKMPARMIARVSRRLV